MATKEPLLQGVGDRPTFAEATVGDGRVEDRSTFAEASSLPEAAEYEAVGGCP